MNQLPIICPVCKETLPREGRTFRCANNHCFDCAKEGYLNLLLSHQRKSKNPGDDNAMIQARRRFFDSGAYAELQQLIQKTTAGTPDAVRLDCGCGEGALSGDLSGHVIGIDISKDAVRHAAKRYKQATWLVANGMRDLPIADQSLDTILSVLAPRNDPEFARMLKTDGTLLLGVPGENHLIELRTLLDASASDFGEKADEAAQKCAYFFTETGRQTSVVKKTISAEQIADLIQMTPIFWTASTEAKEKVSQLDCLEITFSFVLLSFSPRSN